MILIKMAFVFLISSVYAEEFQWVGNSAENCDFHGIYLKDFPSTKAECGPKCESNPECTHYAWGPFHSGGNCVLKKGPVSKSDAYSTLNTYCGIKSTISSPNSQNNVKSTNDQSKIYNLIKEIKKTEGTKLIVVNF